MRKFQTVLSIILIVMTVMCGITAIVEGSVDVISYVCMCGIAILNIVQTLLERYIPKR